MKKISIVMAALLAFGALGLSAGAHGKHHRRDRMNSVCEFVTECSSECRYECNEEIREEVRTKREARRGDNRAHCPGFCR